MLDVSRASYGGAQRVGSRPSPLSPQHLATYRRFGWLLARAFFAPSEVKELARWTDELAALPEEPGRHMVYREPSLVDTGRQVLQRIENFCPFHVQFGAFVRTGSLRDAIDQLLGTSSCLFKEKINFKMPGGAGFEPHQDQQAGWSRYAKLFVTALITIDPATIANGCLEMADCARFTGLLGDEWRPLTAKETKSFTLVPVPTEPGDVLFFDSYAPHASKPNFTERQRRILYLTFNAASDGDHHDRYFSDKRVHFPPDVERVPGVDYKFRV